jgi:reverse transcriptase-like protein
MRAELVLPALSALSGPSKRPESASAFHRAIQASDEACHLDEPSRARPAPVPRRRGAYERWLLGWDIQQGGGGGQSVEWFFDNISHEWLLGNIPMDKVVLRRWLQAGYIEMDTLFATEAGTPQGGVISPVLANMTLDGLEEAVLSSVAPTERTRRPFKVHVVRYADDFAVTAVSQDS